MEKKYYSVKPLISFLSLVALSMTMLMAFAEAFPFYDGWPPCREKRDLLDGKKEVFTACIEEWSKKEAGPMVEEHPCQKEYQLVVESAKVVRQCLVKWSGRNPEGKNIQGK